MNWCGNKPIHKYKGEVRPVKFIAECLGISEHALRHRWQQCRKKGWPEERAYDPQYWKPQRGQIRIKCPDGKYRNLKELGEMLDCNPETVRGRLKILKKKRLKQSELFNKSRWTYKKRKSTKYSYDPNDSGPITAEEMKLLKKIPGPSELERRVFG